MSALDASKEEKEKFILQQIESTINTTREEMKKYVASVLYGITNVIRVKEDE